MLDLTVLSHSYPIEAGDLGRVSSVLKFKNGVVIIMSISIKLEIFEGPFELLFHLIEKAQVDIYDIPIADIADQYISYLNMMQSLDIDLASEFLVMAAI